MEVQEAKPDAVPHNIFSWLPPGRFNVLCKYLMGICPAGYRNNDLILRL